MNDVVSIIMAFRDTAPYIEACLNSILEQTYPNWELIAVNDHSLDGAREIVKAYSNKDNRIKLFDSPGQKLIPALQEGQKHISGSLINRMDSDDKMPANKLEILVKEWKNHGKGHVIAGGTEHFVDEGEVGAGFRRYEKWLNHIAKHSLHTQEVYKECVIPSHSWLMHKDDFLNIGGFDSNIYPEDYDLTFRIYKSNLKIIGIDNILHYWRDRQERISRTWDCYKDNRYFELKLNNFLDIDRNYERPLILWGAGRNAKEMAQLLISKKTDFSWVCDNKNKYGKDIYGVKIMPLEAIKLYKEPQIIICVSSPDFQAEIRDYLKQISKEPVKDYWFFL